MYIITVLPYSDSSLYCYALCEAISALRMYVAVVFPYPVGRGVTGWYQSLG